MKKLRIKQVILLLSAILISLSILLLQGSAEKITADSKTSAVGYKYTVCEYEGKVAVFIFGEKTPETILNCRIEGLPKTDAENLRKGINVYNDSELQYLIEAFD